MKLCVVEEHTVGSRDIAPGWYRFWQPLPYLSDADFLFLRRHMIGGRVFRIVPAEDSQSRDTGFAPPTKESVDALFVLS